MRRLVIGAQMIILCLLLAACGRSGGAGGNQAEELALSIRTEYLGMETCSAKLAVTADYGQRVYEYGLDLDWQKTSGFTLLVTAPEDVAGVTILVEADQTALMYDGVRIETGAITPDGLSPIDTIPAFFHYAGEGFIASCVEEDMDEIQTLRIYYRDPEVEAGTGTECSLWFDKATHGLVLGELSVDGSVVIRCAFADFQMT